MNEIKTALLQLPQQKSTGEALSKGIEACKLAKAKGADIILFPEMWSIGYQPPFENAWDFPDEEGHDKEIADWNALAVDEDSDFIKVFKALAAELKTAIVITYLRKGNTKLTNSLSVIDKNGDIILTYSKVHTCSFSMEKHLEAGNGFKTAKLETGKGKINIGTMICFDREFPESARTLALMGAEIILVPNCCPFDDNRKSQLKARAFENMTAVAMANYSDFGHSMAFDGMAYDENGNYRDMLLTELDSEEGVEVVSIDIDALRDYRSRESWGGKYRRPDVYYREYKTTEKA